SDADSEGEVVSADDVIPIGVFVSAGTVAAAVVSPQEGELGIDDSKFSIFHTNSEELEGKPIYNRFASIDQMKAVPPPLIGNYMPPFNIPDIDDSQMVYGIKAIDTSEIKTNDDNISHSN
nr:hypothetical protein [Tanacetum cinerariifolium]